MRVLYRIAAFAAFALFSVVAPAAAATLASLPSTLVLSGTGVDYAADVSLGEGFAIGEVSDGTMDYSFDLSAVFDPADPSVSPTGTLLITELPGFAPVFLDALLEEIEVGTDYAALLFGGLLGDAASLFGTKVLVIFTAFDPTEASGTASVEVRRLDQVAPVPLPAAMSLLMTGMGALILVQRRGRQRRAAQ